MTVLRVLVLTGAVSIGFLGAAGWAYWWVDKGLGAVKW